MEPKVSLAKPWGSGRNTLRTYELENFFTWVRYAPDIIAITETRIKYTVPIIYNVNLQGYKFIHVNTHKNAGGVGLYVKNCIDFIVLNKLQTTVIVKLYG